MNIAIFGGAFNPIHKAHTTLAENVLKECNVEKVIFRPTFISPHKSMQYAVPFEHRVNMCKIATKDNDNFIVSTLEENFKGKSYTYRTPLKN
ncbi:MAG: nicotinate-nicotinamide nucleotide adenylyltransferase [Ruminococcus sp.]